MTRRAPRPAPRAPRPAPRAHAHVCEKPHILAEIAIVDAMTAKPPLPEFKKEPQEPGAKCWYINIATGAKGEVCAAGFRGTRR